MKRPNDLIEFMRQENRVEYLQSPKYDMTDKKLDAVEKRHDVSLEAKLFNEDEDCINAKMALSEYDLYVSTLILPGDRPVFFSEYNFEEVDHFKEPDCSKSQMHFNLEIVDDVLSVEHVFDPLEDLSLKSNLLKDFNFNFGFKEYGHLVSELLESQNGGELDWQIYLYASTYWQVVGNSPKAIECLRQSIFLASEDAKFMPLLSLGNVLHRARYSEDAAVVLALAEAYGGQHSNVYFTLGNVHATLLNFNESVENYLRAEKISPEIGGLKGRRHAVRCHQKVDEALERQQSELLESLNELRLYKKQHENWSKVLNEIIDQQASLNTRFRTRMEYESSKLVKSRKEREQECFQINSNGHNYITCSLDYDNGQSEFFSHIGRDSSKSDQEETQSGDVENLVRKLKTC